MPKPDTMDGVDLIAHAHSTTSYMTRLLLGNSTIPICVIGRPDGQEVIIFESNLFSKEVVADILRRSADQLDPSGAGKLLDKEGKPILS